MSFYIVSGFKSVGRGASLFACSFVFIISNYIESSSPSPSWLSIFLFLHTLFF